MTLIKEMIRQAKADGYTDENAEAKVCQDIVLKALSESTLCHNATIKGGVVMRSISHNARRATQDLDIDFIRYSLNDEAIQHFIQKLDCLQDIHIRQIGKITDLKHQDYHGKRVFIEVYDYSGDHIESKIDLGVHKYASIELEEYCFDIACFDGSVNLLINSKEQIFAEKLKSLLIFGIFSTRFKDVFDMCYLSDYLNKSKLIFCFDTLIFNDQSMKENDLEDIIRRVKSVFSSPQYVTRLSGSKNNWLEIEVFEVMEKIVSFMESL